MHDARMPRFGLWWNRVSVDFYFPLRSNYLQLYHLAYHAVSQSYGLDEASSGEESDASDLEVMDVSVEIAKYNSRFKMIFRLLWLK